MGNRFQSTTREVRLSVTIENADKEAQAAASALDNLQQIAAQTESAVNRVGQASALTGGQVQRAQSAMRALGANQSIAAGIATNLDAVEELLNAIGSPELADGVQQIAKAGEAIEALPSLGESFKSVPTVIADAAKALGTSGIGLIGSLGALGAAAAGLVIVFSQVIGTINEGKTQISNAVVGLQEYFRLTEFGTEQQIRQQIEELEQQRRVAELALETVRASRAYAQEQYNSADLVNRALILASGVFGQLNTEIANLESQVAATNQEIASLEQALPRVIERGAELVSGLEALIAANERAAQVELQTSLQIANMTADQARDRIEQIEDEIRITDALIAQGRFSGETLNNLQDRLRGLTIESSLLQEALDGVLAERERETNLLEASKKLLNERAKIEEQIKNLQERRASAEQELTAAIQKGLEIQAKANAELVQLELDKNEQVQQAQADAADQLLKLQAQNAKAREKIERDFARAASNAIASRDALAFVLAKQARDDQLTNLQEQYEDQEQTIQSSLNKQLEQIEQSYNKQVKAIQDRLTAEIQTQQQEIARRRQTLAQIASELNQALQQEQFIRNTYLSLNQQVLQAAFQNMYQQIVAFGNNAVAALQFAFQQAAAPSPQTLAPVAGGVIASPTGSFGFSPTQVITGGGTGSRSVTINVQGATSRQVSAASRREAIELFDRVLTEILVD